MTETAQKPVVASAGGPFTCKTCFGKRYFGIHLERGAAIPPCPNCRTRITPSTPR